MSEEGTSPITRYSNNDALLPRHPWEPAPMSVEELLFYFPQPTHVSSLRLLDEKGPVYFTVSYKATDDAEFVHLTDVYGNPKVEKSGRIS